MAANSTATADARAGPASSRTPCTAKSVSGPIVARVAERGLVLPRLSGHGEGQREAGDDEEPVAHVVTSRRCSRLRDAGAAVRHMMWCTGSTSCLHCPPAVDDGPAPGGLRLGRARRVPASLEELGLRDRITTGRGTTTRSAPVVRSPRTTSRRWQFFYGDGVAALDVRDGARATSRFTGARRR